MSKCHIVGNYMSWLIIALFYYRTSIKFQKQDDEVKFNNVQDARGQQTHGGIKLFLLKLIQTNKDV